MGRERENVFTLDVYLSKLKIRQQYINRETHFPYILSTMIYNFVVQRANYQQKLYTPLKRKTKICVFYKEKLTNDKLVHNRVVDPLHGRKVTTLSINHKIFPHHVISCGFTNGFNISTNMNENVKERNSLYMRSRFPISLLPYLLVSLNHSIRRWSWKIMLIILTNQILAWVGFTSSLRICWKNNFKILCQILIGKYILENYY